MKKSLLIPLTYFCLHTWLGIPQAQCQVELTMMPNAFDDQYIGCDKEMDRIAPGLLEKEKSEIPLFSTVWENAKNHWQSVKPTFSPHKDFKDEYGIAIVAYTYTTHNGNAFSTTFNAAVRENGTSRAHYMNSFQFKAFHYYLTRDMQLLQEKYKPKYDTKVYRGISNVRFQHTGSGQVRFGHFASSSFSISVAERFGTDTFFTIYTGFGVDIQNFSYHPDQEEVLIPVHEIFNVFPEGNSHFVLRSTNLTCSHFNCAYLGGEKNKECINNSATRDGLAFHSELSRSLFGGSIILVHVAALKLFVSF